MNRVAFVALLSLVLSTSVKDAEAAPGTHVIVEGQLGWGGGSAFADAPAGLVSKLTLGVGGKFKGWPVRFYAIGNVTLADYAGELQTSSGNAETNREWFAWSLGVRMLAPIAPRLRLLVDASVGAGSVSSSAILNGGREQVSASDTTSVLEMGVGLQYRLHYRFSIGLRGDFTFPLSLDAFDVVSEFAGARSSDGSAMNPSVLLTATLHL